MVSTLELVLLYLVAAVLGVVVCRSLKLPPMLGYLVVGVLIGPNALALSQTRIEMTQFVAGTGPGGVKVTTPLLSIAPPQVWAPSSDQV